MVKLSEVLNALLRRGDGLTFLTTAPGIEELISDGRLLQASSRVPLTDALRVVVKTAERLLTHVEHLNDFYVAAVDKTALEALLISAVRCKPNEELGLEKHLDGHEDVDRRAFIASYDLAVKLAKLSVDDPAMTMETFEDILATSPVPVLTRDVLASSDPAGPVLIGPAGPLPELPARFPESLHAGSEVDLTVRVLSVSEDKHEARVKIVRKNDIYSDRVLAQQGAREIDLRFDGYKPESHERADLTGAQYLQLNLRIKAAADCAIHERFYRRAALTLRRVLEPRVPIDELHAAAQRLQLSFPFHLDPRS